jgi:hypothetical protein
MMFASVGGFEATAVILIQWSLCKEHSAWKCGVLVLVGRCTLRVVLVNTFAAFKADGLRAGSIPAQPFNFRIY